MGHCCSKTVPDSVHKVDNPVEANSVSVSACSESAASNNHHHQRRRKPGYSVSPGTPSANGNSNKSTPAHSFAASPWQSPYPAGVAPSPSPARTPGRKFKWPFPPPSPAKPIMSALMKRQGASAAKPKEGPIPEHGEGERTLDKSFGYPKNFAAKYELGKEVGRGHFGHTCWAKGKKGELKNQPVAVKIVSKAKVCGMCLEFILLVLTIH